MPKRDKMLGVITAELSNSYQTRIWLSVQRHAAALGYGVITFRGSHLDSPAEPAANFVYDLASDRTVDGLVVVSASIATYIGEGRLQSAFRLWSSMPTVSVGVRMANASSVVVDGGGAVDRLVRHLAEDHQRRRFALVSGPPKHAEVMARRETYLRSLETLRLPLDSRLVSAGPWTREAGEEAAEELLASGVPFDALFCMNDLMAIGAIRRLRSHGLRVPEDISVIGFDGLAEGQELIRPLSCAVQPLEEIGSEAVELLDRLLAGNEPENRVLHCGVLVAESCGCPPPAVTQAHPTEAEQEKEGNEGDVLEHLANLVDKDDREGFLRELNSAAVGSALSGRNPSQWTTVAASLLKDGGASDKGNEKRRSILDAADALIGEIRVRDERARAVEREERLERLWAVSSSLAGSFELDLLLANLRRGLIELDIGECFVVLFVPGKPHTWGRLVSAPGTTLVDRAQFRTDRILPASVGSEWRTQSWVLEPLVFQQESLGYMLLPGGYEGPPLYESVRGQVASAVKGALLLEQVHSHERTLEREVRRRTRELTRTNAELTHEIERRVRLEREVADISNQTMERIGQDLHDDLCQHLAGIAMLAEVVEGSLAGRNASEAGSMRRIRELLEDSITRAKQIARGLSPTGLESHGLPTAIESLVKSTSKSYQVPIDFRASPAFSLSDTDQALQVYRIVQEALSNAVKHSGSKQIVVTLSQDQDTGTKGANGALRLLAEVHDMGTGFTESNGSEGMGLRIMRYRAEKAGLELEILPGSPGTRVICRIPRVRRRSL